MRELSINEQDVMARLAWITKTRKADPTQTRKCKIEKKKIESHIKYNQNDYLHWLFDSNS